MKLLRATRDESHTIYIRNSHNTKNNASGIHSRPCTANVLSKMRTIFWKLMVKLHSTSHRATMACVLLTLRGNDLQNLSCQASSYVLVPKHTATGVVQVWRSVTVHFKTTKGAHKAVSMDAAIASALSEQEHLLLWKKSKETEALKQFSWWMTLLLSSQLRQEFDLRSGSPSGSAALLLI